MTRPARKSRRTFNLGAGAKKRTRNGITVYREFLSDAPVPPTAPEALLHQIIARANTYLADMPGPEQAYYIEASPSGGNPGRWVCREADITPGGLVSWQRGSPVRSLLSDRYLFETGSPLDHAWQARCHANAALRHIAAGDHQSAIPECMSAVNAWWWLSFSDIYEPSLAAYRDVKAARPQTGRRKKEWASVLAAELVQRYPAAEFAVRWGAIPCDDDDDNSVRYAGFEVFREGDMLVASSRIAPKDRLSKDSFRRRYFQPAANRQKK